MSEQCDTSSHSRESGVPGRSHCLHVVSRAFIRVLGDRRRLSEAEAQRFASKNGLTESRKDIQSSPQKEQKTKHRSCDDRFILARARHALSNQRRRSRKLPGDARNGRRLQRTGTCQLFRLPPAVHQKTTLCPQAPAIMDSALGPSKTTSTPWQCFSTASRDK